AGLCAAEPRDQRRDLLRRQLAALAGLRALGDLDLELLGTREVGGCDTEPGTGDLFDRAVMPVAVLVLDVPGGVLAAFTRVACHAEPTEADGQGLVGFGREGTEGHGRTDEPAQDAGRRFDLGQRNWLTDAVQPELVANGRRRAGQRLAVGGDRIGRG